MTYLKAPFKALPVLLILAAVQFGSTGCVGPGGGGDGGEVYGGGVWFSDGGWDRGGGPGWYGRNNGAAYIHPNGGQRGGNGDREAGHAGSSGASHSGGGGTSGGGGGGHGGGGGDHDHK